MKAAVISFPGSNCDLDYTGPFRPLPVLSAS